MRHSKELYKDLMIVNNKVIKWLRTSRAGNCKDRQAGENQSQLQ